MKINLLKKKKKLNQIYEFKIKIYMINEKKIYIHICITVVKATSEKYSISLWFVKKQSK